MSQSQFRSSVFFKFLSIVQIFILSVFFVLPSGVVQAQTFSVLSLPKPGTMVTPSEQFVPPLLKGISLHKENPLVFDFIVDHGNANLSQDAVQKEVQQLVKYFLASLTIPDKDLWVNLSPYENNKIIPQEFGQTEMGRDLLAQDYVLKQLSASMIYPEKDLGKDFWNRVYKKAVEKYGTTDIPMSAFNKVWIVPEKAVVVETADTAYIVKSRLKVLMEEDYIAMDQSRASEILGPNRPAENEFNEVSSVSSQLVREIIIPEIEKEVNEGKNFSQLRQIYNSLILASWFKDNLKNNILNEIYSNQAKTLGVDVADKTDKEKIYQQYLAAYRQGVFNYIKEDLDPATGEPLPRKYFSGGFAGQEIGNVRREQAQTPEQFRNSGGDDAAFEGTGDQSKVTIAVTGVRDGAAIAKNIQDLASADQAVKAAAIDYLFREGDETALQPLRELLNATPQTDTSTEALRAAIGAIEGRLAAFKAAQVQQRKQGLLGRVGELVNAFVAKGLKVLDAAYLKALYSKYLKGREELELNKTIVATASFEQNARRQVFGVFNSKEIVGQSDYVQAAKRVFLNVIQMKGGLGTSYERRRTLQRLRGLADVKDVVLADKATDSIFENQDVSGITSDGTGASSNISVAAFKAQQYVYLAQQGDFAHINVQELVNDESEGPVRNFYEQPYYLNKGETIAEVFENTPGLSLDQQFIVQGVLPVVDAQTNEFIDNPKATAPGGHGFLGTLTLDRIANNAPTGANPVITTIVNGDGVNNFLPAEVAGWMVEKNIPIVMITTTKTGLDMKGGLVVAESQSPLPEAIRTKLNNGETLTQEDIASVQLTAQLFELAQAKSVGQADLFQEMGLTQGEVGGQLFNTNLSAYNENVLHPFLQELKAILGADRYFEITTPDLIANPKEKTVDGQKRQVYQMEGAKGSSLLNLNKFVMTTDNPEVIALKQKYGITRLVYFVNFDADKRTEVFTPEKYAWDHGIYERSDLFQPNVVTGRLEKLGDPAKLPSIDLDNFYVDVENVNNAFGSKVGMQDLNYLAVKGKVLFPNAILKGTVLIKSAAEAVIDLNQHKDLFTTTVDQRLVLDNVFVIISANGEVTVERITDVGQAMIRFEQKDSANVVTAGQKETNDLGAEEDARRLLAAKEQAATGSANVQPPGGIDLSPAKWNIEINRENGGLNVQFDPQLLDEIRQRGIEGFVPVIINIETIKSALPLLSQGADESPVQTASI